MTIQPRDSHVGVTWPEAHVYAMDFRADAISEERLAHFAVPLPTALTHAVLIRRFEFAAGRFCAAKALAAAGAPLTTVGIGPSRAPIWPSGFIGSITHVRGHVAAIAASTAVFAGLGIDCEEIADEVRAQSIRRLILTAEDEQVLAASQLTEAQGVTLIFSAKESIYKCLNPLVGAYFDFQDAAITDLDLNQGTFSFKLLKTIGGGFSSDFSHSGLFKISAGRIFTGVALAKTARP